MEQISNTTSTNYVIKFKKAIKFEGKDYSEIDFSKIEDLTGADLNKANKLYRNGSTNTSVLPEMDLQYCFIIAHLVTSLPIEFFNSLPSQYCVKIRTMVMQYFFAQD